MDATADGAHDELRCGLWRDEQDVCPESAVVSVVGRDGDPEWGCEAHAAEALDAIAGARISQVGNWDAARRLLALPWNHRGAQL